MILQKLKKLGIPITEEEVKNLSSDSVGRPHIALALIQKGVVFSIKEAFQRFLGEGKVAYDPGERITVEETIQAIHAGGGKAIIAHPHLLKRSTTIRALLKMPFDGLEGYYSKIAPEEEKKWIDIAQQKRWLITGGSDFHGDVRPQVNLGCSWVGSETFNILYDHYCAQKTV